MTDDAVETNDTYEVRRDFLDKHIMLVYPTLGYWRGYCKIANDDITTSAKGQVLEEDQITSPQAKLLTSSYPVDSDGVPWLSRFGKLTSKLNRIKDKYTLPFSLNGVRIAPRSSCYAMLHEFYGLTVGGLRAQIKKAEEEYDYYTRARLQQKLADVLENNDVTANTPVYDENVDEQSLAYDLHQTANEFCNNWASIREQLKDRSKVFPLVEKRVPTDARSIRKKFHLSVVPIELAGGSAGVVDIDDLDAHRTSVEAACRQQVEAAIETMIARPRQQLAEAISDVQQLIANSGKITTKSFNPVRQAIANIRMFEFVANDEILAQLKNMENQLDITSTADLRNSADAAEAFSVAIGAVKQAVFDEAEIANQIERFGRPLRAINL